MTSTFGWLALDPEHRRRMMEAVDQFRDQGTVDNLGLGGIRDAFSDTLFPGTSTLHTRLRYVLFIPWLLQDASHKASLAEMQSAFRENEFRLIDALKRGETAGGAEGVMGREAGRNLHRLPSAVYWGMLSRWQIFTPGFTTRSYFERELLRREEVATAPQADDPEARVHLTPTGLDERLPDPPRRLLTRADFTLRPHEAAYLSETITRTTAGSALAHLVVHRPATWTNADSTPDTIGHPAIRSELPVDLDTLVDRAERFALLAHGANLLYNLLLAEETRRTDRHGNDLTEDYRNRLSDWFAEAQERRPFYQDDRTQAAQMVAQRGRRLTPLTASFLATWADTVTAARTVADLIEPPSTGDLIRQRERQVKGSRARFAPGNQRALDGWSGASGTNRYSYRWSYVRRHLQDLYDARDVA
ncbi:DUF6361 family protein [Ruania albidiflava]|uniref:DUF6361 family protein n=1 Tax=Ruania albidiflava TaxID=366586 RepID=UPI0003B36E1F|nr:DUF6361 family protein [Ruania albidiflava]